MMLSGSLLVAIILGAVMSAAKNSPPALDSCVSLSIACSAYAKAHPNDIWGSSACIIYALCDYPADNVGQTIISVGGNRNGQPRLSEARFSNLTSGITTSMSQQNYIDAYYYTVEISPNATYPSSSDVQTPAEEFANLAAWTGFCGESIPYSNIADFLEYSASPGVCGAVDSCDPSAPAPTFPCVPQPATDNGSCNEVKNLCHDVITQGLFQTETCVMASMCYAESSTEVLITYLYTAYNQPAPTSEARLSEDVFYDITDGNDVMILQNAIDAYYGTLDASNGPWPTSSTYISNFWDIISAWTGFCETKEIPYANLADYFQYAATSGYHPTC